MFSDLNPQIQMTEQQEHKLRVKTEEDNNAARTVNNIQCPLEINKIRIKR